jgi:phosphonate transport system substrate-binding protein
LSGGGQSFVVHQRIAHDTGARWKRLADAWSIESGPDHERQIASPQASREPPKVIRRRCIGAGLLIALALAACSRSEVPQGRSAPGEVRFSILLRPGDRDPRPFWRPILADMQSRTGLAVTPVFSSDARQLTEAMKAKQTDVGLFSGRAALEADRGAGGQVFARALEADGLEGDASALIVAARSKITLDEVLRCGRRLSFALGDAESISASLAPLTYLFAPRGIDPTSCFRQVRTIGDGRSRLSDVASGKVDLAAGDAGAWSPEPGVEPRPANGVRAIWLSPLLPTDSLIWRKDLDPAVKETLRQFFLTYGQGDGAEAGRRRAALAALGFGGFEPADEGHLLPIREMEATKQWLEARKTKDPATLAAAARTLESIKAERMALEARTRAPAAAQ